MNIPPSWHTQRWNGALHQFRMWVTHIKSSMYDCIFGGAGWLALSLYLQCSSNIFIQLSSIFILFCCVWVSVSVSQSEPDQQFADLCLCVRAKWRTVGKWAGQVLWPRAVQHTAARVSSWLYNPAGRLPLNPQQRLTQAYQEQPAQCWNTTVTWLH